MEEQGGQSACSQNSAGRRGEAECQIRELRLHRSSYLLSQRAAYIMMPSRYIKQICRFFGLNRGSWTWQAECEIRLDCKIIYHVL